MSVTRITVYVLTMMVFVMVTLSGLHAQKSRKDLEREKLENLKKIEEAEKILGETETEKNATLGQLKALSRQIQVRQQLIQSISAEIKYLTGEIAESTIVISSLENDLTQLKEEYSTMIYSASKTRRGINRLTFLFASSTFNQFWMRLQYLEQYAEMRKKQVEQIEKVRDALSEQKKEEELKRREQNSLLADQIQENRKLKNLQGKQTSLITELSNRQNQLKEELESRKKAVTSLDNLIAESIKKEMEKSTAGTNVAEISTSFSQNRARLPWPVSTGFISSKFGRHPHPVLKGIMVENQGVDIQTQTGESVKAVFDGEVVTKAFVPGMNNVVIVKHGNYYTLYAKLKSVNVSKGQSVLAAESIGEVFTNKDGISEVQFQVWKNQEKMDPLKWLVARQ